MTSIVTTSPSDVSNRDINSAPQGGGLVTVIIPTYNHAQFVGDAIQSVLDQEYRNFEIIVVDDGSTDDSHTVVAEFGTQVRYIWQENRGLSAARNTGIEAATGAYISLLDADDILEPNFLSTLVSILGAEPEFAGVYCGYQFVDHLNHPLPQREDRLIAEDQLFQTLAGGNFLVPESILVRRLCYESAGLFDESLDACEDWDMWLRITSRYKISGTKQILTRHRILPGSMSTDPIRMLNNRLAVLKKHFGEEPIESEDGNLKRYSYGRAYLASSIEYRQYGDKETAFECLRKMAKVCPDLLTQQDTFYQLGCGDQPKGSLGHFATLDLQRNAQVLLDTLDRLFGDSEMRMWLAGVRRPAYANAYSALALLSYGARRFRDTRRFLSSALVTDPRHALNRWFVITWLKSLLGARLVDNFKNRRNKIVSWNLFS
jgi:glycosyltransferase involved in cell wall biosynthesis